jgi:hypothetical protein
LDFGISEPGLGERQFENVAADGGWGGCLFRSLSHWSKAQSSLFLSGRGKRRFAAPGISHQCVFLNLKG